MRPKPPCPHCGECNVLLLGGGTHGKYRYNCIDCELNGTPVEWQQIPPHRITDNAGIVVKASKRYRCKKCGLPKRGHVCGKYAPADEANDDPPPPIDLPMPFPLAPIALCLPFQEGDTAKITNTQ